MNYLYRASELDGTVVVQRGGDIWYGGNVNDISGQGNGHGQGGQQGGMRQWSGSPGRQQQGLPRQGQSMY